jgi:transposase
LPISVALCSVLHIALPFALHSSVPAVVVLVFDTIMPFHKISRDLKLAAMRIHNQGILSVPEIIDCLQIGRSTFYHVLDLWRTTGDVVRRTNGVRGGPRLLHFDDIDYLRQIIRACPDWFLNEMLELLENNHFISAHYSTIHRELVHTGVSTKKLKKIALERNENLRVDYIHHMAQYSPEQVGFLDEISKDERTSSRSRGRSRKGMHAVKKGVFVCGRHFSAEGLLTIDGMVANTVIEGSMTRDLFLQFLEFTVV